MTVGELIVQLQQIGNPQALVLLDDSAGTSMDSITDASESATPAITYGEYGANGSHPGVGTVTLVGA